MNKSGQRTDPWETPLRTLASLEDSNSSMVREKISCEMQLIMLIDEFSETM